MRDIFQFTLKKHELSLSSLGFFEHSQPGGGGGGGVRFRSLTVTFLLLIQIKRNFAQLLSDISSTFWLCNFLEMCYDVIVMS